MLHLETPAQKDTVTEYMRVLEGPLSTAPGSCSSVILSWSATSKNFGLIQCSISHLPTVWSTVNNVPACRYEDTDVGFHVALFLTWSSAILLQPLNCCTCRSFPIAAVCYPCTYCEGAMCTLSPLNIGAGAYKVPLWCSWLGNLPSNTHIWYSYIIFWLPLHMPICSDGIVPAHKMVCQLH